MSYSVQQVSERYAVSEHTVWSWINSGALKAIDVSRNATRRPRWRITKEALEAFEQSRTPSPQTPKARRRNRKSTETIEFYK